MFEQSAKLLERAQKVIPGGVNSPVRAFKSVGGTPPFIERASGAHIWDVDGNRYIDFVLTWGPAIVGHAHPEVVEACTRVLRKGSSFGAPTQLEVELAEVVCERVKGVDLVRLVSSGTEACMSAIRLARGATGRNKVIKFEGCYHGHADSFLIAAGSGALTLGTPNSPGVTEGTVQDTLIAEFNNLDSVAALFDAHRDHVAALIVEPVCGNTGCIPPMPGFLEGLRKLCSQHGAVLIFDEVMTGFRVHSGGASTLYGVVPDLFCFGKVIGGGFPLAAYGGSESLMRQVSPDGPVYQAGTLSGNPVAVMAGLTTLKLLDDDAYSTLERQGSHLEAGLRALIDQGGYPLSVHRVGSMFGLFFTDEPIATHQDVAQCDFERFNDFFHRGLRSGVYLAPSQYEAGFLCLQHSVSVLDEVLESTRQSLAHVFAQA
jgi:glutamate-1-semialdehyde 2,1-aminomutase